MTTTIIITGAAGFLGRAVVEALEHEKSTADLAIIPVSRRTIDGCVQVPSYDAVPEGDVLIHLAGESDRARANALGAAYERESARALDVLLRKNYAKVIFASSAVLYGDQKGLLHPVTDPVTANDSYSRAKLEGERMVLGDSQNPIPGRLVVRLANLYGQGMASSTVMATILRQAREKPNKPLEIFDDKPVRDFLWIQDAASAIAKMALQYKVAKGNHGLYNLGSGIGVSVGEIARLALALAGHPERPIVATKPSGRFSALMLDITATKADWAWEPKVSLAQGVGRLIKG